MKIWQSYISSYTFIRSGKQRPSSSKNRRPTEPEEYEHQTDELEAEALYVDPDECMSVYMKIPHLK